ncbi:hypothetical protein NA56DRAFT_744611 [Hyaloscypha hepaticicola]|uniref:Uncharacterized protein n=1 Tax=Hyaloscypha hepaticicola TaxID=2082293 RepID=A0A2J6QJL5_9HELO|nr:hypothetical protein NA56DRAFT_744611 [Hyaloscypha hepaticicola]
MDGEGFGSDAMRSNWDVYKDAFAPPAPSRRVKAWERAPVSAHAPRLQGQKVWKKVGMRTFSKEDDKENCEAAQEELEKGGMGSRKRVRVRGGKENISNALWKTSRVEEDGGDVMVMGSPKKMRMSMGPGDIDAFVVPRKRTNTNHLITPRKPGRKTPLMEQSQPMNTAGSSPKFFAYGPTKLSPQKIPLNDQEIAHESTTTFTSAKTAVQKVVLNGLDQTEEGTTVPAEKLVRRRNSLRRSTRRLTRAMTPEQQPAAPAESTKANQPSEVPAPNLETVTEPAPKVENSVIEEAPKNPESIENVFGLFDPVAISIEESHETPVPAAVEQQAALESAESKTPSSQKEEDILAGCSPVTPKTPTGDLEEDSPIQQPENISPQASSTFQQFSNDAIDAGTVIEVSFGAAAKMIPESQPTVLNSTEIRTEIQFSPTKASGTPRQRRKTPQRRGSRRSTRSNRADSVPLEDQPVHATPQIQNAHLNVSPAESRMVKTPNQKSRRPSDQEGAVEKRLSSQVGMSQDAEPTATATASKQNVEVETRAQQMTSTKIEGLVTTQPFGSNLQSEHADITGPIIECISSETDNHVENPNLAITARVEEEILSSGAVNVQADAPFDTAITTTFVPSEFESFSPLQVSQPEELKQNAKLPSHESRRGSVETLEVLEPISISLSTGKLQEDSTEEAPDELPGSSTPNPSTSELIETISENAPVNTFDQDDTDMLRSFLTRVKANKAAKAVTSIPKRKRSLPHSPLRIPLGSVDSSLSPSSPKSKDEFDVSLPVDRAAKRKMDDAELGYDEATQLKSIRRSGRTRLPVKAAPLAAPSFIPVRRLGQDGDNTVTLRRNEEKELAALTRINTRKNKAGAQLPLQVLAKQAEEKEDPASRQRALKEVFDEKVLKQKKGKKGKSVVWAEELAQFQTEEGKTAELDKEPEKEKEKAVPAEERKNAVKVGVRSKMTLGMVNNGTPAPKRKVRGRT